MDETELPGVQELAVELLDQLAQPRHLHVDGAVVYIVVAAAGEVLALVGPSGSGKTTLARLVFRLYDPVKGQISLEGADLRHARLADLRRSIAIVTQDVQLFKASVRDNLTFFDRSVPDERIIKTLEELELARAAYGDAARSVLASRL